uniref:HR7 protein n=1 Tax=Solanum tuberosum TaxID=4113 RepID=M1A258_SOLTU
MASFKQAFLFITFFFAILVNLSWAPNKMQGMALRHLPIEFAAMKGKLLRLGDISNCGSPCKSRSDCKEGVICSNCVSLGALFSQCM